MYSQVWLPYCLPDGATSQSWEGKTTKLETYKPKMSFQIEITYFEERKNLLINNKQGIHHPEWLTNMKFNVQNYYHIRKTITMWKRALDEMMRWFQPKTNCVHHWRISFGNSKSIIFVLIVCIFLLPYIIIYISLVGLRVGIYNYHVHNNWLDIT